MAKQDQRPVDASQRMELRARLAHLLPGASPESLDALARAARFHRFAPGERIYRQGEPVLLTLILSGRATFARVTAEGQRVMSGVSNPGALFGWTAATGTVSSVEAAALTTCEVAQWPGQQLRAAIQEDAGLCMLAIESLAASLHTIIEQIEGFLHQDARRRVVRVLDRHRELFFSDPPLLTRAHLPALVGTSREMSGRVLRQLEREGTLRRVGRAGLVLLEPAGLAEHARSEPTPRQPS